ncbi:MAG: hypothetical protein ACYC0E_05380 [Acidimicrobiales bacterium]
MAAAASTLAALSTFTAALGDSAGAATSSSTLHQLQKAASRSARAGSAEMSMSESVSGVGRAGADLLRATGEVDFSPAAADLTLNAPSLGIATPLRVIEVGATAYLRSQKTLGPLQAGKWYSESEQQAGAGAGISIGPSGFGSTNPSQMLSLLAAEGARVERIGPSVVDRVPTTEYSVHVDLMKALAHARANGGPSETPQGLQIIQQLFGTKELPMTVWIDGHSLVRQLRVSLHLGAGSSFRGAGAASGGGATTVTIEMTMTHYGRRVAIRPPPSSVPEPTGVIPAQ